MSKRWIFGALVATLVVACGGSGGGDNNNNGGGATGTTPPVVTQPNALAVTVDAGPSALTALGAVAANTLFATVTVCTPGSATACRAIDHIQVDTGSTGLRLIASALGSAVPTPSTDPATGRALRECVQFADGYSYGSVGLVDVTLGSRTVSSLPIQVIGDAAAGTAPASCVSGPQENTVAAFGANGILGVGNFMQDCGAACVTRAIAATYYVCTSTTGSSCTPTTIALAQQVSNPVAKFSADSNGVTVVLPAVASPGATSLAGTVYFGVGTQADNALGSAQVFKLTSGGTFTATYSGTSVPGSFIDSGSNAYFFSSSIPACRDATFFYCPVTSSGARTSVSQTATINGTNGVSATVTFNIDNADTLFATSFTAFPGLGGPNGMLTGGLAGAFDFGLPFFFGRSVYVIIEGSTVAGVTGPAVAF